MAIERYRKQLALSAASTVFALLIIEAVFRVLGLTGYHAPRTREWAHALVADSDRVPGVSKQFMPHSTFRFCYDSNPKGYFDSDSCLTYAVNNVGVRDHDYAVEKPPGVKRLVILGDSFAFGEGVRLQHRFSTLLEKRLVDAGLKVEVLNFSVGGWGTRDEISYLEHVGMMFDPDLVLVAYVLNDADYAGGLDVWQNFTSQYEKSWLRFSSLLSFAYARLGQRSFVKSYVAAMTTRSLGERDQWTSSFDELDRGKELALRNGAKFGVAILPFMYELSADYPFRPIDRMIEEACRKNGIPVADLLPALLGNAYADLWVHPSDPHPNKKGHELIAEGLYNFILRSQLGESLGIVGH